MNSRIIAALSAAVMGVACFSPGISAAQSSDQKAKELAAAKAPSEGTALAAPLTQSPSGRSLMDTTGKEPTTGRTGEVLLRPADRQ
jgi:hypothetical protein